MTIPKIYCQVIGESNYEAHLFSSVTTVLHHSTEVHCKVTPQQKQRFIIGLSQHLIRISFSKDALSPVVLHLSPSISHSQSLSRSGAAERAGLGEL